MIKLGLLGCGNMGESLLQGILDKGVLRKDEIMVFERDLEKSAVLSDRWGVAAAADETSLAESCAMALVAVKPQDVEGLLEKIADPVNRDNKVLITIAAGLRTGAYRRFMASNPLARVMPNTPLLIGRGASGIYFDGVFTEELRKQVLSLFEAASLVIEVKKEELLDAVTGLSGSGPAYVFSFISALADGGVKEGLARDVALRLAIQTVIGAAELAGQSAREGVHLEEMKDRVTSPGGTTAAGLFALEKGRFRYSVIRAVQEAAKRSRELGRK